MVVAAAGSVDPGCASEIPHDNNQGFIQPAPLLQVVDERREDPIEQRQHRLLHAVEVIVMRVPMVRHRIAEIVKRTHHGHNRHATSISRRARRAL